MGIADWFGRREAAADRILDLPVDKVYQNPYQPRRLFPSDGMEQLRRSIREYGVLVPIVVRRVPQGYELACGERRLRASRDLGRPTIPAIVRALSTPQMVELALIENLVRSDLAILEEADAFGRLKSEFHVRTDEELAARLGIAPEKVARYSRLSALPLLLKKALQEGHILEDHAMILATVSDADALRSRLAETIRGKLSPEELRDRIRTAAGA